MVRYLVVTAVLSGWSLLPPCSVHVCMCTCMCMVRHTSSLAFGSAPLSSSILTVSVCPFSAARCRAWCPREVRAARSAPSGVQETRQTHKDTRLLRASWSFHQSSIVRYETGHRLLTPYRDTHLRQPVSVPLRQVILSY